MSAKSPDNVDVEVGARIRELRTKAGLSQTALAQELGITFQQVQKYETGSNRVSSGRLTRIAEFLEVPITTLLGVDGEQGYRGKGARQAAPPLQLVTPPGAMRLLRAYASIDDGIVRRSLVAMVETIVNRPIGKSRKR